MSITTLVSTCLWFLLVVPSLTGANEVNVNCLRSIKSQVKDPKGSLSSWVFHNGTSSYVCGFIGVECWDVDRVLSIDLSGFGLQGEFPLGLKECSSLTGLDLSGNNFSGSLPSNIASLIPFVTTLDLSYNQFSGEIPAGLSDVTYLNTIMLQHNHFTGQIPPEIASLKRLKQFSVAENQLTGPVPEFNEALGIGVESFANNTDLCGWPMDYCIEQEEKVSRFGKMGAAIGAAVFAPVGAFLGWFFRKEKQ
ncbi:unnamed protein product [Eruca vesicaria subsp. sativa]|uniref:Leucine-rich repeat-containing N-terminal plant-type domain-containing protein n=1 Tax=Eruca vesicaria subsp. sativa TaxID=29727 RepID=A0ABC8JU34_ERUVS|nr:unnamed protein product [Eruca vesicaria subsp. sativa]